MTDRVILVTGFEPFGGDTMNPSQELAKAIDGRRVDECVVHGALLPVHHADACAAIPRLVAELDPCAVLHLGLAGGRARIALERVALNVMDYRLADNAGYRADGEPCVVDGPPAYFTTLPIRQMLGALIAEGIPAYISDTAGTFLCNQTLYATLHLVERERRSTRVGFMHLPLLPAMVATSGLEQPSMDVSLMLRALETSLAVIAAARDRAA